MTIAPSIISSYYGSRVSETRSIKNQSGNELVEGEVLPSVLDKNRLDSVVVLWLYLPPIFTCSSASGGEIGLFWWASKWTSTLVIIETDCFNLERQSKLRKTLQPYRTDRQDRSCYSWQSRHLYIFPMPLLPPNREEISDDSGNVKFPNAASATGYLSAIIATLFPKQSRGRRHCCGLPMH